MKPRSKAELFLALTTVIWGATFVIVKQGLDSASPLIFMALRFGTAALLFLPFCLAGLASLSRSTLWKGIFLGSVLFAGFAAQTFGLQYTTSSKSGFITGMLVVFTPILQLAIERRPPKVGNLLGAGLVAIGLYFLTRPEGASFNSGDGLTLLCAGFFALQIVCLDLFSKPADASRLTFLQIGVAALLSLLGAVVFGEKRLELTRDLWLGVSYLAVLATLVAFYLQTRFQGQTSPTRAAIIFSLEPVFSAIFAYQFRDEHLGMLGVLGGGLIVLGLVISEASDVLFRSGEN